MLDVDPEAFGREALPEVNVDLKRFIVIILVAFVVLSAWNNPSGTAEAFGNFLGDVGNWLQDLVDKTTEFFRGLTE